MKKPIDIDDLLSRVSGNREFACRMLDSYFANWKERQEQLEYHLNHENYDELSDCAHQLKGILGNLSITKGFNLLNLIYSEAKLKNPRRIVTLLNKLKKEIRAAETYYKENHNLFHT
jgi:HPt (histidine-containing phosphotransfer) domain-containing protein